MTASYWPYTVITREDGKIISSNIKAFPEGKWLNKIELSDIQANLEAEASRIPTERKFSKQKINRLR